MAAPRWAARQRAPCCALRRLLLMPASGLPASPWSRFATQKAPASNLQPPFRSDSRKQPRQTRSTTCRAMQAPHRPSILQRAVRPQGGKANEERCEAEFQAEKQRLQAKAQRLQNHEERLVGAFYPDNSEFQRRAAWWVPALPPPPPSVGVRLLQPWLCVRLCAACMHTSLPPLPLAQEPGAARGGGAGRRQGRGGGCRAREGAPVAGAAAARGGGHGAPLDRHLQHLLHAPR